MDKRRRTEIYVQEMKDNRFAVIVDGRREQVLTYSNHKTNYAHNFMRDIKYVLGHTNREMEELVSTGKVVVRCQFLSGYTNYIGLKNRNWILS